MTVAVSVTRLDSAWHVRQVSSTGAPGPGRTAPPSESPLRVPRPAPDLAGRPARDSESGWRAGGGKDREGGRLGDGGDSDGGLETGELRKDSDSDSSWGMVEAGEGGGGGMGNAGPDGLTLIFRVGFKSRVNPPAAAQLERQTRNGPRTDSDLLSSY
jgi:hypothetical protein